MGWKEAYDDEYEKRVKAEAGISELETRHTSDMVEITAMGDRIKELEERERELLRVIGDRERDNEHLEAEVKRLQSLLDRWGYPKPPGITSCSANTDQGASE